MAADPLVAATGVSVRVGGRAVLDRVDLDVSRGEIVTLIGPNGSGKTTLVRALLGLLGPDAGTVSRAPHLRIGYVPQHFSVDSALPLTVGRFLTLSARAKPRRLAEALDDVGAPGLLESPVDGISGGELRRVLLARALLADPDLLVLDEPSAGVDVAGQVGLYALIRELRERRHCAVLLVSHDLHLVMAATDRVFCLNRHVCCTGAPESVRRHPEFIALFGPEWGELMAPYAHRHDHHHALSGEPIPEGGAGAASTANAEPS